MVAETNRAEGGRRRWRSVQDRFHSGGRALRPLRKALSGIGQAATSSLTRRIVILNLAALLALASGILYLNKFRAGLIDTRVESLMTQGQIIAAAIAAQASVDTGAITIDPDKLLELQAGQSGAPYSSSEAAADFPINPK
jgi:two-component system sensor histidine kinase ChvG